MKNRIILQFLICVLGFLCLTSFVLGGNQTVVKPIEVIIPPPDPLPVVWDSVRLGHWIHGVNWPWDNYGTDFGSAWSYSGLANQGPGGWRREIQNNIGAAKRLFWAEKENPDYCMGVDVELNTSNSTAIIYYDIQELAENGEKAALNLAGKSVTVKLYFLNGLQGDNNTPTNAWLFFKDTAGNWAQNIYTNLAIGDTNKWISLSADLDNLVVIDAGFNNQQVKVVGVKISANSNANGFSYEGPFYIDSLITSGTTELNFDFNKPETRSEKEIKDLTDSTKVNCLRWWLLADGRSALVFDQNGYVTGLNEHFWDDFHEMIRFARSTKTYIVPVLFDFLLGGIPDTVDNVPIYGHADLISDQSKRASLLNNAVAKIFDTLAVTNEVVMIDMFNEPEWLLLASDNIVPAENRPEEIEPGGVVSLNDMKTFFSEIIGLHQSKHLRQPITIGSASSRWVALWDSIDTKYQAHIDSFYIAQFHLWNRPGNIDNGKKFDSISPSRFRTFLGEFSSMNDVIDTSSTYLEKALNLGYSGAFPWAYRAKDTVSLSKLGERMRDSLRQFTINHSYIENFGTTDIKGKSTVGQPKEYVLYQNYPNPFNPTTNISFRLIKKSFVSLKVYDILGREVTTIISEILPAGNYARQWNASDMSSGIYFYRLQAGNFTETKKLVLLR